jgi:hypothetical protein
MPNAKLRLRRAVIAVGPAASKDFLHSILVYVADEDGAYAETA